MKIYIAGKITGLPPDVAKSKFEEAASFILSMGHDPVNPLDIAIKKGYNKKSYKFIMKKCIKRLIACDAILMISGWSESAGAQLEHHIAEVCGLTIYK